MIRFLTLFILLVMISCARDHDGRGVYLKAGSIINGRLVHEGDPLKSQVVALIDQKTNAICTGVIIAQNIILTAAHCTPEDRVSDLKVVFSKDAYDTKADEYLIRSVIEFKPHELFVANSDQADIDIHDIALVKFVGDLPTGYQEASFLNDQKLLSKSRMATIVGYGINNIETIEIKASEVDDLEDALKHGKIICNRPRTYCLGLERSGMGVLRKTRAPIVDVTEKEVVLNERKAATCNGDSGGPAFLKLENKFFLFGVTSRGDTFCDGEGIYTNVLEYMTWINETIATLE